MLYYKELILPWPARTSEPVTLCTVPMLTEHDKILASLREFWNHLLRRLAPDELVMKWVPEDDKDLLKDGQPTRRARFYMCAAIFVTAH